MQLRLINLFGGTNMNIRDTWNDAITNYTFEEASSTWTMLYDKDGNEVGRVDQNGNFEYTI